MAEQIVDEKSDDLDIVSTGKLYQGPWEKKYWSSSRGKDRHPYPVGYVAHRTYNGNTYKMAILEGLKGPEFSISSTDGETCSGQTPDIAWEGFQKKSCVRIKFWRGKRFSCKIDGAELFGFKNPLVARLLRGLKANASPISDQSFSSSCKDPDLQMKLVKTENKEKGSKKRKEVNVKPVSGTQHKRERPQDLTQTENNPGPTSTKTSDEKWDPPVQKVSQMMDNMDLYAPDTLDPALADEKSDQQVKKDSLNDVDLCALDTLDSTLDMVPEEAKCSINEKSNAAQISVSEKSVTESQSNEMAINTGSDNSYRSDSDSVGQEITNSMMTLLLPRALPLLKTYSRKKKKNQYVESQPPAKSFEELHLDNNQCVDDSTAIAPDSFENHQSEGHNVFPNVKLSEEIWHAGKTTNETKLYHIEGTTTTVDVKSTNPVGWISTHCDMTKIVHNDEEVKDESNLSNLTKTVHDDNLQNIFELVGCYVHPTPILTVMLRTKGNEVFICVLCGYLMEKDMTLFVYKTFIKGKTKGHPCFIGHTKIISPISKYASRDQIIQFTPDGKCIVLLNNIKAPYCREVGVKCQFSGCTADSFEKNAVKIVQVKIGYVHVVCKLKTTNNVSCILVCEPSYLVASEENGRVNLWSMNSTWSEVTEHCYLPTSDCMPNTIIEIKRVPNFPSLVVGHTAFVDFCLWDLTRRILVSKFSASGTSILSFLPINIFKCPKSGCKKKQVVDMMEETQICSLLTDKEDLSLVLLVSNSLKDSGNWSLALLAKNKLVLLNALDPSSTVAGATAGYGIIGTCDGSLYIWELSSGTKLGYLSHCKEATVSCLVADDSDSGVFAVAVDGSQLQVYAKNHEEIKVPFPPK